MKSDVAKIYPERLIKNEAWRAGVLLSEDEISAILIQAKDNMSKQNIRVLIAEIRLSRNVKPH